MVPKENEKDLKEIPAQIKRAIEIIPVEHMDEVLTQALALDDPQGFLREGDHVVDSIFEGHPAPAAAEDLGAPAGVN